MRAKAKSVYPAILAVIAMPLVILADSPKVDLSNVRRVFDNGEHNAFTDLVVFKDAFYLAFRSCPDGHGVSPNASIIILSSRDTKAWKEVHRFSVPGRDTRDPHFLVFRETLFVYTGTWFSGETAIQDNEDLDLNLHLGYTACSKDGQAWSQPKILEGTFGHYIWRAASFGEKAYLCGRRKVGFAVGPHGEPDQVESLMLESDDGLIWRKGATFQETRGDETAFLFERNGNILAIGRRGRAKAQLLRSEPPYKKWHRHTLDRYIGGPLIMKWGGRIVVGGRRSEKTGPRTSLCWLNGKTLDEFAQLPSSGDNSYPGFIPITPSSAVVSWYSSHEKTDAGKTMTAIYMADLAIAQDSTHISNKQRQAIAAADRVLACQRANGGWAKGAGNQGELELLFARQREDTTLDNGTTHSQIRRLAEAHSMSDLPRFKHGAMAGIEYLLDAQYENGGWPQRYPRRDGYARFITYNDGAMVGALGVLRDAAEGSGPFAWVGKNMRVQVAGAVARGIDCLLACQVKVNGVLTAWGQQHDEISFLPRPARSFEPVSLCSSESVGVVQFLMSLESPGPGIINAVHAAIAWLSGPARLEGIRQINDPLTGKHIIEDEQAPSLWARLYEIGSNRPVFGNRDGKVYYALADISDERRDGYSWYVNSPQKLIGEDYPLWQKRIAGQGPERR
jgi:PelA/Pel-15E family pectate lyase